MECIGVKRHNINIYSQLSDYNSQKIFFCERSSTLPPHGSYRFDNQEFIAGGIMGGIRVELREVPP